MSTRFRVSKLQMLRCDMWNFIEGKKIFRVEGVKGRHFFVLNFSPPMKGEITKIQIAQQEPSLVLEIFAFLLCWRRNQEMSKLSLFCCVSPRFLCWVATVCTWTLLPFTKVSIELRNLRKNFLKKPCKGKQKFEMYAKLGYSIEKSIC